MNKVLEERNCVVYENRLGNIRLAHFALAFGEPMRVLELIMAKPDGGPETERQLTPDEAIQFALDLIKLAVSVKEKIVRWETNRTPAY